MCISLPAVATQSAVLPTWQHFDYQLVASRGVTSLVANETPSRARQLRTLPCCPGRRWGCASVCIHSAQGSVLPHKQFWEFCIEEAERYIPDIFIVVSKYSYSKMYCWAAFWPQLKRLRHSSHDYIQCWSLHCLVSCIIAFFPQFLCYALNWQMLATGVSGRRRLIEWR